MVCHRQLGLGLTSLPHAAPTGRDGWVGESSDGGTTLAVSLGARWGAGERVLELLDHRGRQRGGIRGRQLRILQNKHDTVNGIMHREKGLCNNSFRLSQLLK